MTDMTTAASRVVSARDVFVSRPGSGEPYARHPRAVDYDNAMQLLAEDSHRQYNFLLKLLMVGDADVGKSSYLLRLTESDFPITYMHTIGVDFKVLYRGFCDPVLPTSVESSPVGLKLQIWERVGSELFRMTSSAFFRGTAGYLLCFDLTRRRSFENIPHWISEIRQFSRKDAPIVLIGMKQDIPWPGSTGEADGSCSFRQVSYDEGFAMAQQYDMPYLECSAKNNVHIDDVLATLVYHIIRCRSDLPHEERSDAGGRCDVSTSQPSPAESEPSLCVTS